MRRRCGSTSKGGKIKTKGIHFSAAEAISEYIKVAGIESGPLFRPRVSHHGEALAARRIMERTMYRILMSYLRRLQGAMETTQSPSDEGLAACVYSPHSLRATTATLLLASSVPIESVQDLLDHTFSGRLAGAATAMRTYVWLCTSGLHRWCFVNHLADLTS